MTISQKKCCCPTVHKPAQNSRLQVYCLDDGSSRSRRLAAQLQLPMTTDSQAKVVLAYLDSRLALMDRRQPQLRPLWIELGVRARAVPDRRDPLLRALGKNCHSVVDATAGWGVDAAGLLRCGYRLKLLERHPVMCALLQDAIKRLGSRLHSHIELLAGDAITLLPALTAQSDRFCADVVYFDTMYPETGRSRALPRRELVLLRELAGTDEDAKSLLTVACQVAKQRVVVKRPHYAPTLHGDRVDMVYRSKLVRYDVYLVH